MLLGRLIVVVHHQGKREIQLSIDGNDIEKIPPLSGAQISEGRSTKEGKRATLYPTILLVGCVFAKVH